MKKNVMKSSNYKRCKPRKEDEQKHHGEMKNNNGETKVIRGP